VLRFVRRRRRDTDRPGVPTLMIGAGSTGRVLAQALLADPRGMRPIGFLDDDSEHRRICGLPLLGRPEEIVDVAASTGARAAVLALPSMSRESVAELVGRAWAAGLEVRWLPTCPEHGKRGVRVEDLREIRLSWLIGRDEVSVAGSRAWRLIDGRRVLVTGASGTVGAALSREIARLGPAGLWLLDQDTDELDRLQREVPGAQQVAVDLRDAERLARAFDEIRPELVFHTEGRSRLAPQELDPCEAVRTNVRITHDVVNAAVRFGVRRVGLVSTDKAADPASVFGATKRLAEMVAQTAAGGATCFATVRLGNLIGTPGSLLSVLASRIPRNEAVTITHPEVARHFMTVEEAAGLVLEAAALAEEAETFVLDMGSLVPVVDLVHRYAEQLCLPEVTIRFSGLGPGEKLAEKVFSDSERQVRTAHPKIWATRPTPLPPGLSRLLDALYEAADQGDDAEVRILLRRLLPEYRPVRRPGPTFAPSVATDPESL
jgi:FlaA1/EpsC-like NDP-sugar epimerase